MRTEHVYEDYGFDDYKNPQVYRGNEYNIVAEGISSEDSSYVDLSEAGYAKYLSMSKISNDEFSKAVMHIKKYLLPFQDSKITYTTVAHTLQATIQLAFFPLSEAPILWVQGTTGCGKSSLAKFAQAFHGNFPRLINVGGTPKAIEMFSMLFKDALLVLDDYKEGYYRYGTIKLLQNIYDRSARVKLKKSGEQAKAPFCRGLLMVTSEDKPASEASTLARCLYVEAPQITTTDSDDDESSEGYRALKDHQDLFPGVTARFVHYILANYSGSKEIGNKFNSIYDLLVKPVRKLQNAPRIAQNLAANYVVWELFCDFLKDNLMLTKDEYAEYLDNHWNNVLNLREEMAVSCSREQASNVFLGALREGILSGTLQIDGMASVNDRAKSVGFVHGNDESSVYIYPTVSVGEVKKIMSARGAPISHSLDAIGRQLAQDGYIVSCLPGRTQTRKQFRGSRAYVWHLDAKKTELGPGGGNDDVESKPQQEEDDQTNLLDMANFARRS